MANDCVGQWGTAQLDIPDILKPIRETINNVAELLLTILNIVKSILNLVKTFLRGFIDPIAALVQRIIDEINRIIRDLRQLGIYLTGDWTQLAYGWPFEELRGGYAEYQRRMVKRLTDTSDPTRPDISGNTKVFALFFYLSVDISSVERLISFIKMLMALFNQTYRTTTQPSCIIQDVKYGAEAVDIAQPKSIADFYSQTADQFNDGRYRDPSLALVEWITSQSGKRNPFNPFPPGPPGGFIVSLSTVPDGIQVFYDQDKSDVAPVSDPFAPSQQIPARKYGRVMTESGQPLVIYGGVDQLANVTATGAYTHTDSSGKPDRNPRFYGKLNGSDGGVIPLDRLNQSGKKALQRFLFVPSTDTAAQFMLGSFVKSINKTDMPYGATILTGGRPDIVLDNDPASTVYVRVAACSKSIANAGEFQYDFNPQGINNSSMVLTARPTRGFSSDDIGPWSEPVKVTFPNENTREYLNALRAALLVLVLSRVDYKTSEDFPIPEMAEKIKNGEDFSNALYREPCGLEDFRHMLYWMSNGNLLSLWRKRPAAFRRFIERLIEKFVYQIYDKAGSNPALEKLVVENTQTLRTVTWKEILDEVGEGCVPTEDWDVPLYAGLNIRDENNGIAAYPAGMGIPEEKVVQFNYYSDVYRNRASSQMLLNLQEVDTSTNNPAFDVVNSASVNPEGTIEYDPVTALLVQDLETQSFQQGSADVSPVFYTDASTLAIKAQEFSQPGRAGVCFCRGMFLTYRDGIIIQETQYALTQASALFKKGKGEWLTFRFFDMFPGIEDFWISFKNGQMPLEFLWIPL